MAKIIDPIYLSWRSTHGAVTGSAFRTSAVARRHSLPIRRVTAHQQSWVDNRSPVLIAWRSLSPVEQADWSLFGQTWPELDRYGVLVELSGWNWFNRLNVRAQQFGLTLLLAPPADPFPDYASTFSVYFDFGLGAWRLLASNPPAGIERLICTRRINLPVSYSLPPVPFPMFSYFSSADFPDPVVCNLLEFRAIPSLFWLSLSCIDSNFRAAPDYYCFGVNN